MIKDSDLVALCIYCEAWQESDDGKAAVARVILNRMRIPYESDGTVQGTILKYDQFSWAWFAFVNGKYTRISDNQQMALSVAEFKIRHAPLTAIAKCAAIYAAVKSGTYKGQAYEQMTDDAVLYLNPHIVEHIPNWATPDKWVCSIGNHNFYKA